MNKKYQSGNADNHLSFIQNDVFNYIESNYKAEDNNRTYFGYSLGGTFGAYILLTQPKMFKNYILGSPETLLDDSYIHNYNAISTQKLKKIEANVFISTGALERKDLMEQAKELDSMLKKYKNISLKFKIIKSADHGKAFPMSAVQSMYWLSEFIKNDND